MSAEAALVSEGVDAAGHLLAEYARAPVEKAIDPLDPGGFLRISSRLTRAIRRKTGDAEVEALRAALGHLDVDWPRLTVAERDAVVAAARAAIRGAGETAAPQLDAELRAVGTRVFGSTRAGMSAKYDLQLGVDLSQRDLRAEEYVRTSTLAYVRDEYGRASESLGELARQVVGRGLGQGFGADAITAELAESLGEEVLSESYLRVVAMSFVGHARTFAQLDALSEAGVESYAFEAVLDEVTTDQCRYYHGRVFSVAAGVGAMDAVMAAKTPEEARDAAPWIRTGKGEDGASVLYFSRGGERVVVAQVDRSGVGARDDRGGFSKGMSTEELQKSGAIPWPPLHGHCRSTLIPGL